jgi:hypothetical protein
MLKKHAMEGKFDSKHFNNSTNKHKNEKKRKRNLACKTSKENK